MPQEHRVNAQCPAEEDVLKDEPACEGGQNNEDEHEGVPTDTGWSYVIAMCVFVLMFLQATYDQFIIVLFVDLIDLFEAPLSQLTTSFTIFYITGSISCLVTSNILVPRFRLRTVTLAGGLGYAFSTFLYSLAPSTVPFLCCFALKGFSRGMLLLCPPTILGQYFKKRHNFAQSVANVGIPLAIIISPHIAKALRAHFGVRGTLLLLSGFELHYLPFALLMRPTQLYRERFHRRRRQAQLLLVETETTQTQTPKNDSNDHNSSFQLSPQTIGVRRQSIIGSGILGEHRGSRPTQDEKEHSRNAKGCEIVEGNRDIRYREEEKEGVIVYRSVPNLYQREIITKYSNSISKCRSLVHVSAVENIDSSIHYVQRDSAGYLQYTRKTPENISKSNGELVYLKTATKDCKVKSERSEKEECDVRRNSYGNSNTGLFHILLKPEEAGASQEDESSPFLESSRDRHKHTNETSDDEILMVLPTLESRQNIEATPVGSKLREIFDISLFKICLFRVYVVAAALSVAASSLIVYLPTIAVRDGHGRSQAASLLSIIGFVDMGSRIVMGCVADSGILTKAQMISFSTAILSITCHVTGYVTGSYPALVTVAVVTGLFVGARHNMQATVLVDYVGIDRLPKALALVSVCMSITTAINHPIIGSLVDATGDFTAPLHYMGSLVALCSMLLALEPLFRRMSDKSNRKI